MHTEDSLLCLLLKRYVQYFYSNVTLHKSDKHIEEMQLAQI